MPRKPFTKLLTASLSLGGTLALAMSLAGCKPDVCKDPSLTQAQRCANCMPKSSKHDEVLARLNPTQLPWPVRKNIEGCIDKHADDLFLTKQGLRECIESDSNLDGPTKMSVLELIQRSNVMEQADLENFHANCSVANLRVAPAGNVTPDSPFVPPSRVESAPPPAAVTPTPPPPAAAPAAPRPAAPAPAAAPAAPRPATPPAARPSAPAARPASPPPPAADPFM